MSLPQSDEAPENSDTGYALSLSNFERLLREIANEPTIAALLQEWFAVVATNENGVIKISSSDGREVPYAELYAKIQNDEKKQYTLYQRAMDMWR